MNVLLFGLLADVTGDSAIEMEATDTDTLKKNLLNKYPALNNYRFQLAVNRKKIENNILLHGDDEIALLPPFSGG